MVSSFLRDCASGSTPLSLDPTKPLYIIELGAGTGKFGFGFLKRLFEVHQVSIQAACWDNKEENG